MTTISDTLKDAAGNAVAGERVTAKLVAATEVLTAGGQIIREVATVSDSNGAWSLTLTPTSELVEDGGAYYLIMAAGFRWSIAVPATGGPYALGDDGILVEPGPLSATGVTTATFNAAIAARPPAVILDADDELPTVTEETIIFRKSA